MNLVGICKSFELEILGNISQKSSILFSVKCNFNNHGGLDIDWIWHIKRNPRKRVLVSHQTRTHTQQILKRNNFGGLGRNMLI